MGIYNQKCSTSNFLKLMHFYFDHFFLDRSNIGCPLPHLFNWGSDFETVGSVVYPEAAALYTGAAWRWWFGGEQGQVAGGHKSRHPNSGHDAFAINLRSDGYGLLAGADAANTGKPIGAIFAPLSTRFKIIGSKLKRDWAMEQKKHVSPDRLPFHITATWPLN